MNGAWLGLDGAAGAFSAALVPSDPAGEPRTAEAAGNDALERGLDVVDAVLQDFPPADLAGVAVGTGPGSFTGLRIALSYAKALAFAWNRPLVGISSYDALEPADAPLPCATFVHGRAGAGSVRLRGPDGDVFVHSGTYAELAAAIGKLVAAETVLWAYGAAAGVAPALGERGIVVRVLANGSAPPALAIARRAALARATTPAHAVRADYGEAHYAERTES